jgi:hypothetical protein
MRRTYGNWTKLVLAWAVLVSPLGACSREAPANRGSDRDGDAAKVTGCELITGAEIQEATGLSPDKSGVPAEHARADGLGHEGSRDEPGRWRRHYAFWHGAGYLNVAQGNNLLVWIIAEPAGEKPKQEAAVELARKALPRI